MLGGHLVAANWNPRRERTAASFKEAPGFLKSLGGEPIGAAFACSGRIDVTENTTNVIGSVTCSKEQEAANPKPPAVPFPIGANVPKKGLHYFRNDQTYFVINGTETQVVDVDGTLNKEKVPWSEFRAQRVEHKEIPCGDWDNAEMRAEAILRNEARMFVDSDKTTKPRTTKLAPSDIYKEFVKIQDLLKDPPALLTLDDYFKGFIKDRKYKNDESYSEERGRNFLGKFSPDDLRTYVDKDLNNTIEDIIKRWNVKRFHK